MEKIKSLKLERARAKGEVTPETLQEDVTNFDMERAELMIILTMTKEGQVWLSHTNGGVMEKVGLLEFGKQILIEGA